MSEKSRQFFTETEREKIRFPRVFFSKWSYGPVEFDYENPERVSFRQKSEIFLLNVRKLWMMDKIYSFFRNRLFTQKFPEDLQNAALTKPLKTAEKNPEFLLNIPKR